MTVKDALLDILEQNRGAELSGGKLAKELGVSRNAVWKAVNALKDEGYDIASSGRGYLLAPDCDVLSAAGVRALMEADLPVFYEKTADSTNAWARKSGEELALFVAGSQTAGRGRLGRQFASPEGGVYMSFIFSPRTEIKNVSSVTAAACVAVLEAVERVSGRRLMIKWVNDLYLDGKKVCGILTEAVTDWESGRAEQVVVGVGINLKSGSLPKELADTARGLDTKVTRCALIAAIADGLYKATRDLDDRSWFDTYRERQLAAGREITYYENGVPHAATALGVDRDGGLVIRADGEQKTLRSGEITVRLR